MFAKTSFLISGSSRGICPSLSGISGQSVSSFYRNWAPFSHLTDFKNGSMFDPREASSAGLSLELTYLHCLSWDSSQINETLLATKVWYLLVLLWIYPNTDVLFVQKTESLSSCCCSLLSIRSTFTASAAAVSSSLGIVICLRGVTLDFPRTNATQTLPAVLVSLR